MYILIYIFIFCKNAYVLIGWFLNKYRRNAERYGTLPHKVYPEELPYERLLWKRSVAFRRSGSFIEKYV